MAKHAHIFESDGPWRTETAACTRCGLSVRAYQAALDEDLEIAGEELGHIEAERDELAAQNAVLREAAHLAWVHTTELRLAWERGAISEHDGKGGQRSNRNIDVVTLLDDALADPAPRADALLAVVEAAQELIAALTAAQQQHETELETDETDWPGRAVAAARKTIALSSLRDALARLDGEGE